MQRHCTAQPRPYPAFQESDVIQTLVRTVVDFSTSNKDAAADEGEWLMDVLSYLGGHELYLRYMRLSDRVNGTDLATECDLDC